MYTLTKAARKTSWFARLRTRAIVLCFSLILLCLAVPSVATSAHAQTTTTTAAALSSPSRLMHVTELGTFTYGGITMINEKVGWTFTNKVQRTSDGGKSWQTVAQGNAQEYIGQLEVLDDQTAWYLTDDAQTYATTALYRTNDGGQTWTRFPWIDPSLQMVSISILDNQYAWVNTTNYSAANQVTHLFLVGGASQNWQAVTSPGPNGASSIYFLSPKVGWATVSTPGTSNSTDTLYETRDGGETWIQQNLAAPAGLPANAIISGIAVIGFGDQSVGYLSVSFGDSASYTQYTPQIYRTLDGGRSWDMYGSSQPEALPTIVQLDQWHTSSQFMEVIVNGGADLAMLSQGTWRTQHITFPTNFLMLSFLTDRVMFMSGFTPDGTAQVLYKTLDGGATWQTIATLPAY